MVTPFRDWLITQNEEPAQSTAEEQIRARLFRFKDLLIDTGAGAWTVAASCGWNGASWDVGAADYWPDADAVLGDTAGNDHAWCLLQHDSGAQLLVDRKYADTRKAYLRLSRPGDAFDVSTPVSTDAPTDPTTALSEGGEIVFVENTAAANWRLNFWRDAAGSFLLGMGRASDGFLSVRVQFLVLETEYEDFVADVADYPFFVSIQGWTGTWTNAFQRANFCSGSMWTGGGFPTAAYIDQRNNISGMGPSGTNAGTYPRFALEAYTDGPSEFAMRGIFVDFGVIPGAPATNELEPGADPIRRLTVGQVDLLTNGDTTLNL